VAPLALRLLSVRTSDPPMPPLDVGTKLMGRAHDVPCASVPGDPAPLLTSGQAVVPLLSSVKFAEMLGLFPLRGAGKFRSALPLLAIVTVCGLSELVEPTSVEAKLNDGGLLRSIIFTALLCVSAT
jgi:hypothetical protein